MVGRFLLCGGVVFGVLLTAASGSSVSFATNGPIAFESTRAGNPDIYVARGGKVTRLTRDPAQDTTPSWSPDGRRIVFASNRGGRWRLFVMSASGSGQKPLRTLAETPFFPRFSPDGRRIAFQSFDGRGRSSVRVMDAGGGNERLLSPPRVDDTSPSCSPDGDTIVVSRGFGERYGLYLIDVATGEARRLTSPGADFEPDFSPSGDRVAFSRLDRSGNYDVFVMPARPGARAQQLTQDEGEDGGPVFSPDGRDLVFRTSREGLYSLWVVPARGGRQTPLLPSVPGVDVAPDWAQARAAVSSLRRFLAGATRRERALAFFCPSAFTGTDAGNTIDGTGVANNICGLGGADKLRGMGGNDQIDGGSGNDKFRNSAGTLVDGLLGGLGDDILYARARSAPVGDCDYVSGGDGPDTAWVDRAAVPCMASLSTPDLWTAVTTVRPP
jgi:Tol biopolymer transport system component